MIPKLGHTDESTGGLLKILTPCSHPQHFEIMCWVCNLQVETYIFFEMQVTLLRSSLGATDVECGFTGFGMDQNNVLPALSSLKRSFINDDCLQVSFPLPPLITSGKMKQLPVSHDFS